MTEAMITARNIEHAQEAAPAANRPRVAYLTNVYPKNSHSFIRNEILALERQNFAVTRLTVRASPDLLVDACDLHERDNTFILLDGRIAVMLWPALKRAARRPRAFLRALGVARSALRHGGARLVQCAAYVLEACRLADRMEAEGIRHIHVHFGTNPATVARIAIRLGAFSYSLTMHGPDEFDAPERLQLREKVADASFVVAISAFGRSQIMRWAAPDDWSKIAVIRCGSGPQFMNHVTPITDAGLSGHALLCVARLSPQKGIPLLIEAVAMVASTRDLHLNIIGDGPMRPEIEAQIAELGLNGVVTLMGWCDAQSVWRAMLAARAMVLPSFAEGLPIVIIEALALGRTVISTQIAGIPELIDPSVGWLIAPGSVTALAGAINAVLDAPGDQLRAMGHAGRERVEAAHDLDENVADLADLLRPLA
ncbi:glycosyltransferase involved in cell wall biosynthesis [Novosphingobium sp. SG751A]|uniref:glycosyltransferase n=1 Tax=Novosphingobium sp. SG751A TaxID=2587000 RepID=UPI001552424A|nr:glycosyltransferase [Novosphingobium sp. SG751A]NOW46450.1 glycosyltransferase involved in cell wall biosynthesis [Novosphingobium sp. SG751A]